MYLKHELRCSSHCYNRVPRLSAGRQGALTSPVKYARLCLSVVVMCVVVCRIEFKIVTKVFEKCAQNCTNRRHRFVDGG